MIPVYQKEVDDCFRAAVASVLRINLDDIPPFNKEETEGFYDENGKPLKYGGVEGFQKYINRMNKDFLPKYNCNILRIQFQQGKPNGMAIADAIVKTGKMKGFRHALVCYDGKIIHDPLKNAGRIYEFDNSYFIFTILDPSLSVQYTEMIKRMKIK